MQIKRQQLSPTTVKLTITADAALMQAAKDATLKRLGRSMKLSGFRPGKAPMPIVERNADPSALQTEFLDDALNRLYGAAIDQEKLRPVDQPKVTLEKFVPFTELEVSAEVNVVGEVTLPDYKKFKLVKKDPKVTDKDIDEVIESLRTRVADKKDIERAAKKGDEITIDFAGADAKTDMPVQGAEGKAYPLILGSDTFIPGFESNLLGLKTGEEKTFTIPFPKDYGVKALQGRDVTFVVTVQKVQEIVKPEVDDVFAAKVGPFKTVEALREDIRKQLVGEKQTEVNRDFENDLLEMLADKTTVAIPQPLIDEEINRTELQIRQNLNYRGQTWPEYLAEMGQTEEEYRKTLAEPAEKRVRVGLALSEVADKEGITVTPEEFQLRMQLLKGQYADKAMQAELEKPESARQILSGMLTEKTVAKLTEYATAKS